MSNAGVVALRGTSQQDARRFICPARTWEFLRDLGQTFGWQPKGTTYVTRSRQKMPPPPAIRHNYQPGDVQDYKQIEAEDAIEWARALSTAKHSGYFSGMAGAHAGLLDTPEKKALLNIVDEFIDFAREGAFVFAVSTEIPQQQSERDSHA